MPWWLEPDTVYQEKQPEYDRLQAERDAEEELRKHREQQRTGLERFVTGALGVTGGAVRGAFQGATLPRPPGVSQFEQTMAGGLLGGLGETEGTRLQPNWAGVLENQFNMPEGPSLGPVNARGVLGFGLDVGADPLGYVPVGKVSQGLRALPKALEAPIVAPYARRGGFLSAENVLEEGLEKTGAGRALEAVAEKMPGAGRVSDWVSPSLRAANEPEVAMRRGLASMNDQIRGVSDTLRASPGMKQIMASLDDDGRVAIPGGPAVAWNDLMQGVAAGHYAQPPAPVRAAIDDIANAWEDVYQWYAVTKVDKARTVLTPDELAKYEIIPQELKPGARFVPRVALVGDQPAESLANARPGKRGINYPRDYPTMEQGLAHGVKYAGPLESFEIRARDIFTLANRLDMEVALAGQPGAAKILIDKVGMEKAAGAAAFVADVAAGPRVIQTGFDLGGMFIQGVPALARNPDQFVKAFGQMIRSAITLENHEAFLATELSQRVLAAIPNLPVSAGSREYMESAQAGGLVARGLSKLEGLGPVGRAVGGAGKWALGRAESAFDTAGDAMRIYGGEAWLPYLAKHPEDSQKVGEFLGYMSGVVSRAGQGVGKTQQAVERSLLFAPSYMASAFALMGAMLREGPVAKEASLTIADMLVVGLVGYDRMAKALGQTPELDPAKGTFMTVEAGGVRVGIGSTWTALARTLGDIEAKAERIGKGQQDPPQLSDVLDMQNPFIRFFRGRASTPAGAAMDLLDNETYLGVPINNAVDVAREEGKRLLPFAGAGALEALPKVGPGGAAVAAGASFLGLRSTAESFGDVRNKMAQETYGKDYNKLDMDERAEVQALPALKDRPIPPSGRYDRQRQVKTIYEDYESAVNRAAAGVTSGKETKDWFREQEAKAQDVRNARFTDVPAPTDRKLGQLDQDRQTYFKLMEPRPDGSRDYDGAEAFLQSLEPKGQEYIRKRQTAGYAHLGDDAQKLMLDLNKARELLKPYRQIRKEVMERYGLWDDWTAPETGSVERDAMEKTSGYRFARRAWTRQQERMRRSQPEIDAALVEFYGNEPILGRRR